MADILQKLYDEYAKLVKQNTAVISQFEAAFRLISYAIAGRFEDSSLLSELLYSATNLLVLFNDAIIKKGSGILPSVVPSKDHLQSLVTVLEYVGVFIEMASRRWWGEAGRWIAIVMVQLAKAVSRFLLLTKHNVGIQTVPPLAPVDREAILKSLEESTPNEPVTSHPLSRREKTPDVIFTLKRSGKVMRTLSSAPNYRHRDWKIPAATIDGNDEPPLATSELNNNNIKPTQLNKFQNMAECLYIVKPLMHLTAMSIFGTSSFKPWLLSVGLDVISLCMMGETGELQDNEKTELKRRTCVMLMYLLRSPFYQRYTKERLLSFLRLLSNNVPGLHSIITPLIEYLPVWQQIYFYTWSS